MNWYNVLVITLIRVILNFFVKHDANSFTTKSGFEWSCTNFLSNIIGITDKFESTSIFIIVSGNSQKIFSALLGLALLIQLLMKKLKDKNSGKVIHYNFLTNRNYLKVVNTDEIDRLFLLIKTI